MNEKIILEQKEEYEKMKAKKLSFLRENRYKEADIRDENGQIGQIFFLDSANMIEFTKLKFFKSKFQDDIEEEGDDETIILDVNISCVDCPFSENCDEFNVNIDEEDIDELGCSETISIYINEIDKDTDFFEIITGETLTWIQYKNNEEYQYQLIDPHAPSLVSAIHLSSLLLNEKKEFP